MLSVLAQGQASFEGWMELVLGGWLKNSFSTAQTGLGAYAPSYSLVFLFAFGCV